MEQKYFIIKFVSTSGHKWFRGFYRGTMDELAEALKSVYTEIIAEESEKFERLPLVFNRKIRTRSFVFANDTSRADRFYDDVKKVFDRYGAAGWDTFERDIKRAGEHFANIWVEGLVEVCVSDGEERREGNTIYVGGNSIYVPFSEFSEDNFWDNMEYHCGVARPQ